MTATTDSTAGGVTTATYAYDPDGNTTATTGTSTNPFGYASGYLAPGGLYHYGQRYYDPTDARWTQPDPLNQATDLLEANRYPYVGGDPINYADPSGKSIYVVVCVASRTSCRKVLRNIVAGSAGGAAVGGAICATADVPSPVGACAGVGALTGALGGAVTGLVGEGLEAIGL